MSHSEMTWQSFDGLPVYAQAWLPDTGTKAVVALVHGLGEHSGRYGHVAAALNRAGYAVVTRDLRGHGQSGGQKGHAPSFEALLKDIDQLVAQARELVPGKPLFLYGHSLGGIFVLDYALSRHPPIAGVVSTSPGLRTALHEQKAKLAVAKVMGKVAPTGDLASGSTPSLSPAIRLSFRLMSMIPWCTTGSRSARPTSFKRPSPTCTSTAASSPCPCS